MRRKATVATRAVIYARVSSKEQEQEGFSVDAQLRLLRDYAAQNGMDVVKEFAEAETAKRAGRTAFGSMLRFLEGREGYVVLIEKVDRLYRNFADYVKVDDLGVELHFVKDGMVLGESSKSQDKFMHGIRVLMAKNYVDNLSEEIRKGLDEKAAQGIYPTHAPVGYLNTVEPGTKRKIIVPDPARACMVKELFEAYATGGHSLATVTKLAKQIGLTTKKGKPIPKSGIDLLLKHPVYCGIVRWNGKESMGVHEPLVSREVWKRVQSIRTGRGQNNTGYGTLPFAYRGLIRCKCGKVMTGEKKKGKYIYYHCTGSKSSDCDRPYVSEGKITEQFCKLLEGMRVPEDMMPWIEEGLREADKDRIQRRASREKAIGTKLQTLSERIEKLYVDRIDGNVSEQFYLATSKKWESEKVDLELELAALDRTEPVAVDYAMRILELASTAHIRFKNANPDQKRELLVLMLSNCSWVDGKLVVELNELFDLMLNLANKAELLDCQADENKREFVKSVDWWR